MFEAYEKIDDAIHSGKEPDYGAVAEKLDKAMADPPKLLVAETRFGRLDRRWLDHDATLVRPPRFGDHGDQTSSSFLSIAEIALPVASA